MIVWLTGESGSGKTTLANRYCKEHKEWINLDGDEMRRSISVTEGFGRLDRGIHNMRVARLALFLNMQKNIMISVIAPEEIIRKKIDNLCAPKWIYLKRNLPKREGHFYEQSSGYSTIDIDNGTVDENYKILKDFI